MLILKNNKLENFDNNLYTTNDGKISFTKGQKISISQNAKYVVPGFIDQHIHGASGYDLMDNSEEAVIEISKNLIKEGTTSFLATTMTYDLGVIKEVIEKVRTVINKSLYTANILGVHLEGPFISEKFIGAQNPIYIQEPSVEMLKLIDPYDIVKLVTYAPEDDTNFEFTKYLASKKIIASVGHSGATCMCVQEAIKNGLTNFTHFHNASSGHHHRTPGVVTAGLMAKDGIKLELIVDGIHLHPAAVKATYKVKNSSDLILITDSMRAKNMDDGMYEFAGQKVQKLGNEARLENGALAGSVLRLNNAVQNFIKFTNCNEEEAFKMASYNVAKHLNVSNKGLIKEGYDCDVTVLDHNFEVIQTFIDGKEVFSANR